MSWTLVFKQTAPYSFTQSLSTLQTTQVNTSTDANYSILNELYNTNTRTNYEISSGRYRFKVVDDQGREMIFEQDNLWDVVDEDPIVSNPSPSPNPVIISVTGFTLPESGTTFEFDGYMVSPSQWQYISRFNGLLGIAGRFHLAQETYFNDGTPQLSVFSTGNGTILYANTLELYVETPTTVINFASLTSQPSQTNQSLNFNSTVNAFLTNNGFTNWAYDSINFTDSGQIIPGVNSAALDSNTYTYTTAIAIHYSYSSTLLLEKQYSESKRVTIYYGSALIGGPGDTIVRKNGVQIDSANVTQKEVTVYVAAGDTLTIVEETADVALIYAIVETTLTKPVIHYTFDSNGSNSGTFGSSQDLTITHDTINSQNTKYGSGALYINSTAANYSRSIVSTVFSSIPTNWCISLWMKANTFVTINHRIIEVQVSGSGSSNLSFAFHDSNSILLFFWNTSGTVGDYSITGIPNGITPFDNNYHHYFITSQGQTITLYIDGTYVASGTFARTIPGQTMYDLTLGDWRTDNYPSIYFDDVKVFDEIVAIEHAQNTGTTADQTAPTITLLGDATVNVQYNTTYTDAGATATDDTDGDITSSIITTSTVNTSTIGAYSVKYNATDAAGNVATEVIRVVNVVDLTKPTITLTGSSTVTTSVGRTYTDAGATATDNVDGNLTNSITSVSTVDMTTAGIYSITFNVTDAAGNTAVPAVRTIIVEDNVPALSTDTGSVNTVASASISTKDLTSVAVVGNSAAQKRAFTKNAVINMFAKNANALSGKKLVLQAGAVLPGFSESLAEDTILIDGRVSATLNKLDFINKSFYIPMEVNSVVSLDSFNDTVTITQNENDFTIATSTLTTTKVAGDSFSYDHLNIMLGSVYGSLSAPIICFKEGTKITCLDVKTNQDIESPIETIPPNTYVKTYKHGYIQVKKITNHKLENPDSREILKGRLYIYEPCNTTPGLYEPLIMTGCHSALVDSITPEQQQLMEEQVGKTFITDDKYRLMCMYDTRAEPYTVSGIYTIWHICLEHYDEEMNYGIYANGLLVESCSQKNIELMVDTPEPA